MLASAFLARFQCLGDACEDTCCRGWTMQLDPPTKEKYAREAPELLSATVEDGSGGYCMRRDPSTDGCVKLESGLCGIQSAHGAEFLGDACYFYPRVTRRLGELTVMTAASSCPEVTRLALFDADSASFALEAAQEGRLPWSLKDYLPEGIAAADALNVHRAFVDAAGRDDVSPEHSVLTLLIAAGSLARLPVASWAEGAPFFLKSAEGRIPPAETAPADPFNLLHALAGLLVAARRTRNARIMQVAAAMEHALGAAIDWQNVSIALSPQSAARSAALSDAWREWGAQRWSGMLRRWLQLQLSVALFPFAGFGAGPEERMLLIGVRLATLKLALMCLYSDQESDISEEKAMLAVQALSRALDHLADPVFSREVYAEAGWMRPARLRGLLGA